MRDSQLFSILESGSIRGSKKGEASKITKLLSANGRNYSGESEHNGFYDSLL